jgi:AraC-like DNA-binding protein
MHAHHYVQYGLSNSKSFKISSKEWVNSKRVSSFIVPGDVFHQVELGGSDNVLMIWLDPEFSTKRSIPDIHVIETSLGDLESELKPFIEQTLNCDTAHQIRELITGWPVADSMDKLDVRISDSIKWIKRHLSDQTITVEQLAETVYLSPSRLMHLFSEQIGIPIRKYILWQRLRAALLKLANGENITEAAYSAGFTDSPHMNRAFKSNFGITPSKIFKNSRFIQVFGC